MYIKNYTCKRFAGLRDVEIDFEKGINVILGANESGKSTIIEGIHSTLFKDTKLRKNNNPDREFSFKFMPQPSGDFIDGRLIMGLEDGDFEIYKEWGSNENMQLVDEAGNIIKDKNDIRQEIARLLNFGESTYSNIVFAKQSELKAAIGNIIRDRDIKSEISDLLRQTMMELDGISIDKIEGNIDREIDKLYKRWDREKKYPENNKGVNNPYKVGLGEILELYYKKERLKIKMENADKAEKDYERICNEIKELEDKRQALKSEKTELEAIEEDVNTRAILEAELAGIDRELEDLKQANKKWPLTEEDIRRIDVKLSEVKAKRESINEEKKNIEKFKRKESIDKKLKRLEEIEAKIKVLEDEISSMPMITKDNIDKLKQVTKSISEIKITMQASKMIGRLIRAGDKKVYIRKDFEEREVLELDSEFQANGLINISYGDEFEVEISTGDMDFQELTSKYKALEQEESDILKDLAIDSLEAAVKTFEIIMEKKEEVKALSKEVDLVLDGSKRIELEDELESLKDIDQSRDLDEIEQELGALNQEEIDCSSDKLSKANQIRLWQEKYRDHDNLFELVVEENSKSKDRKLKLENLKPLPERFESIEDFKIRLRYLKDQTLHLDGESKSLDSQQYDARDKLLEDTYEELKKEYIDAESAFEKNIKRGEKLLEIRRVFRETKERLSSNPMKSLVDEFARLLEIITLGTYKKSDIDEDFDLRLINKNGEIPMELLSAGTYDAVALALRFSLLKHIFQDKPGYVVLDDCLVDLDPQRKAEAVKLITVFAEDYQVIFTTCDPHTASMLGGNIIEI